MRLCPVCLWYINHREHTNCAQYRREWFTPEGPRMDGFIRNSTIALATWFGA